MTSVEVTPVPTRSRERGLLAELRRSPAVCLALLVLLTFVVASIVALPFTDSANAQHLQLRFGRPWLTGTDGTILGRDQLGRDLVLRVVAGVRSSLIVSTGAMLVGLVAGGLLGMIAAFGGWPDRVVDVMTNVQLALPSLLVVMLLATVLGRNRFSLILLLAAVTWMLYTRMTRALCLSVLQAQFIDASRALGAGRIRLMGSHLLPNVLPTLSGLALLELGRLMLAEAALTFLGFGLSSDSISLGGILADGRDYLTSAWWIATFAGLALALLVLSVLTFGAWLRDHTDPARV